MMKTQNRGSRRTILLSALALCLCLSLGLTCSAFAEGTGAPTVTVPETAELGENVTVTVQNIPADHRYVEYILVGQNDRIMADWSTVYAQDSTCSILLPQEMLDAQPYSLMVNLNMEEWPGDTENSICFEKTFTVTGSAEKTRASLGQEFVLSGRDQGMPVTLETPADRVWIQYGQALYAELATVRAKDPSAPFMDTSWFYDTEPVDFRLRVAVMKDGVRHPYSDWLDFTIRPMSMLRLPARLTAIGAEAFAGTAAEAVRIPGSVTEIAEDAFKDSAVTHIFGVPGSAAEDFANGQDDIVFKAVE